MTAARRSSARQSGQSMILSPVSKLGGGVLGIENSNTACSPSLGAELIGCGDAHL